jgi:hypothetical protein
VVLQEDVHPEPVLLRRRLALVLVRELLPGGEGEVVPGVGAEALPAGLPPAAGAGDGGLADGD